MFLEIIEGSWEHKVIESVIEHKEELADVLMWQEDTFIRACRSLEKSIEQAIKLPDNALLSSSEKAVAIGKPEINQGYTIICNIPAGDEVFVIGQRLRMTGPADRDPAPFVVWKRDKYGKGFNTGSYCSNMNHAIDETERRAKDALEAYVEDTKEIMPKFYNPIRTEENNFVKEIDIHEMIDKFDSYISYVYVTDQYSDLSKAADILNRDFEAREYIADLPDGRKLIMHELTEVARTDDGEPGDFGEETKQWYFIEGKNGKREQLSSDEVKAESINLSAHGNSNMNEHFKLNKDTEEMER